MGVFGNFFPTGTYAGIGSTCVGFENVMKSAQKKKIYIKLVGVKIFWSLSNFNLFILIWSSELASFVSAFDSKYLLISNYGT